MAEPRPARGLDVSGCGDYLEPLPQPAKPVAPCTCDPSPDGIHHWWCGLPGGIMADLAEHFAWAEAVAESIPDSVIEESLQRVLRRAEEGT